MMRKVLYVLILIVSGALVWFFSAWRTDPPALGYEKGMSYSYNFRFKSSEESRSKAMLRKKAGLSEQMRARGLFEGELVLQFLGQKEGRDLFSMEFRRFDTKELFFGEAEKNSATNLSSGRLFVSLAEDGSFHRIFVPKETDTLFARLAKSFVEEFSMPLLRCKNSFVLRNRRGVLASRVSCSHNPFFDRFTIERSPLSYEKLFSFSGKPTQERLSGFVSAKIDSHGIVQGWNGKEELDARHGKDHFVSTVSFSILFQKKEKSKLSMDDFEALFNKSETYVPGQSVRDEEMEQRSLRKMSKGLDEKEVVAFLKKAGSADISTDDVLNFVPRLYAWLGLHPKKSGLLESIFANSETSSMAREIIMQVFAMHSDPRIKAALHAVLGSDELKEDPRFAQIIQKLSFMKKPDQKTGSLVSSIMQKSEGDARYASAYTLGSVVNGLDQQGDKQAAHELNLDIATKLEQAESVEEKERMLIALGNAGMDENMPLVEKYSQSKSATLRVASAHALRHINSPEGEAVLTRLSGDKNKDVQNSALTILSRTKGSPDRLEKIEQQINDGTLDFRNFSMVVNLLKSYISTRPAKVRDICDAMLRQGVPDKQLAATIRELRRKAGQAEPSA